MIFRAAIATGVSFVRWLGDGRARMHDEAGFHGSYVPRASGLALSRLRPIQRQLNSRFQPLWVSGKDRGEREGASVSLANNGTLKARETAS